MLPCGATQSRVIMVHTGVPTAMRRPVASQIGVRCARPIISRDANVLLHDCTSLPRNRCAIRQYQLLVEKGECTSTSTTGCAWGRTVLGLWETHSDTAPPRVFQALAVPSPIQAVLTLLNPEDTSTGACSTAWTLHRSDHKHRRSRHPILECPPDNPELPVGIPS